MKKEQKQEWDANTLCIPYINPPLPRCTVCDCLVSFKHQAVKGVRRHIEGKKHCDNMHALENQQQIQTPPKDVLKCAKKVTWNYNKAHKHTQFHLNT